MQSGNQAPQSFKIKIAHNYFFFLRNYGELINTVIKDTLGTLKVN